MVSGAVIGGRYANEASGALICISVPFEGQFAPGPTSAGILQAPQNGSIPPSGGWLQQKVKGEPGSIKGGGGAGAAPSGNVPGPWNVLQPGTRLEPNWNPTGTRLEHSIKIDKETYGRSNNNSHLRHSISVQRRLEEFDSMLHRWQCDATAAFRPIPGTRTQGGAAHHPEIPHRIGEGGAGRIRSIL